jgi:lysine 2,3-aminomutase
MSNRVIFNTNELLDYMNLMQVNSKWQSEIVEGIKNSTMAIRLTSPVLQLIDWSNIVTDPIRKQFLPLLSEYLLPHPSLKLDSLSEISSQVAPGIVHRYPKKVLFLLTSFCPTYCSFCTRSYLVGPSTEMLSKNTLSKSIAAKTDALINYLKLNSNINDVVISGGDIASVEAQIIDKLLTDLASIESLKTVRLATRTLLFNPKVFLPGTSLFDIITQHYDKFKQRNIELSIQCHFNHPIEISTESQQAALSLWQSGLIIRNQTVLLDGINSNIDVQEKLIKKLIISGIQPYYVYQMDMVANAEHFRTNLATCINISKNLTGAFPGFQLPRFIVDLPGGGGKRSVYEYEFHDKKYGVYGFKSPVISGDKIYYYCDPLRYLEPNIQKEWIEKKTIPILCS